MDESGDKVLLHLKLKKKGYDKTEPVTQESASAVMSEEVQRGLIL